MKTNEEKELVAALQNNSIEAFNALYWNYHSDVYANIFKLTRDIEASKDILQEVFVALWEKRASLDPDKPVGSWIFAVSYNKSVSFLRKSLQLSLAEKGAMEYVLSENAVNTEESKLQLLNLAMEKLSHQKRKVVDLCKIQGMTYEEAARELSISKHTVKEYLGAAMSTIRTFLKTSSFFQLVFLLFLK